jgi:hypothetical protein
MWLGDGKDSHIHSIAIRPEDSRHITVSISCGDAWVSENGCQTWDVAAHGLHPQRFGVGKALHRDADDLFPFLATAD